MVALPGPFGGVSTKANQPAGIQVGKMRVPLGVVAIISESYPKVNADAAALCLNSVDAAIS